MTERLVGPIKSDDWIAEFADYFQMSNERNFVMFMTGIFTGLNMSKILQLKVDDVSGDYVIIQDLNGRDSERVILHPTLKKIIRRYIKGKDKNGLLFPSRERTPEKKERSISVRQAQRILQTAAEEIGYPEKIGTLSLRKTFGYRYYQQYKDIETLKVIFKHNTEEETKRFIGVRNECQ